MVIGKRKKHRHNKFSYNYLGSPTQADINSIQEDHYNYTYSIRYFIKVL